LETVYRDYSSKGVRFYYVYKALAHPERDGYVQPFTIEERLAHVKEAKRRLGTGITWIADSMTNEIKHAFGDRPNSEFLFDPEGKVVTARPWSDPEALRWELEDLVGKVDVVTRIEDLDLPEGFAAARPAASGVVPRLTAPAGLQATHVKPASVKQPYYAKLRAEIDSALFDTGKGQMMLGFHLDPIYGVHWNNLVDPIEWEIKAPEGVLVSPNKGVGPKVDAESDVDPREFLVEVDRCESNGPLELVVRYFGCNDEEGWCMSVTQTYTIEFAADKDAGRPQAGRRGGIGRGGRGGGRGGVGPGGRGGRGRGGFGRGGGFRSFDRED